MELDQNEVRQGAIWFVFAGLFALCVAIGIYSVDVMLNESTFEKDNTYNLREVRSAAQGLGSGNSDVRLRAEFQNID